MNKTNNSIILVILSLFFVLSCNDNFFYKLIPPDNDRITEFVVRLNVDGVEKDDLIPGIISPNGPDDNSIYLEVEPGFKLDNVTVEKITINKDAVIIPIAPYYINKIFEGTGEFSEIDSKTDDSGLIDEIKDTIKKNKNFNPIPLDDPLEEPINFSKPVRFMVISGIGTSRIYTVYPQVTRVEAFSFEASSKNLKLKETIDATVDNVNMIITMFIPLNKYTPPLNTNFVASFITRPADATVTIDGKSVTNKNTSIDYKDYNNTINPKKLFVTANGITKEYDLIIEITPDFELTYFQFRVNNNSTKLKAQVNGVIQKIDYNNYNVNIDIPYGNIIGDKNNTNFVATFDISGSPSSQTLGGVRITSGGSNGFDYRTPKKLVITSKDGTVKKEYTITVTIRQSTDCDLKNFKFETSNNSTRLNDNITGEINQAARTVTIHIPYDKNKDTTATNKKFIASFEADGSVKIGGNEQAGGNTSGNTSEIDYAIPINQTLIVTAANGVNTKTYTVIVTLGQSSDCNLWEFEFEKDNNSTKLKETIDATIDQVAETVEIHIPVSSYNNISDMNFIATFVADGTVKIEGTSMESGVTSIDYKTAKKLVVTAQNGKTKEYTLTVTIEPNLRSFSFGSSNNSTLKDNIDASIDQVDKKVSIYIPLSKNNDTTNKSFVANFNADGGTVKIEGTSMTMTSGAGSVNYGTPKKLVVTSIDGVSEKEYTVTVTFEEANDPRKLSDFWFGGSGGGTYNNPQVLKEDVHFESIIYDSDDTGIITVTLPLSNMVPNWTNFKRLYPQYTFNSTESTAIITDYEGKPTGRIEWTPPTTNPWTNETIPGFFGSTTVNFEEAAKMVITDKDGRKFTYTIIVNWPKK